jgi:chromosome segregation ATPase
MHPSHPNIKNDSTTALYPGKDVEKHSHTVKGDTDYQERLKSDLKFLSNLPEIKDESMLFNLTNQLNTIELQLLCSKIGEFYKGQQKFQREKFEILDKKNKILEEENLLNIDTLRMKNLQIENYKKEYKAFEEKTKSQEISLNQQKHSFEEQLKVLQEKFENNKKNNLTKDSVVESNSMSDQDGTEKRKQIQTFQFEKIRTSLEQKEKELEALKKQLHDFSEKNHHQTKSIDDYEKKLRELQTLNDKHTASASDFTKEKTKMTETMKKLDKLFKVLKVKIQKLKHMKNDFFIQKTQSKKQEFSLFVKSLLSKKLKAVKNSEKECTVKTFNEKIQQINKEWETKISIKDSSSKSLLENLHKKEEEIVNLRTTIVESNKQIHSLREVNEKSESEIKTISAQIEKLKKTSEEHEKIKKKLIDDFNHASKTSHENLNNLNEKIKLAKELNIKIDELQKRINHLEKENSTKDDSFKHLQLKLNESETKRMEFENEDSKIHHHLKLNQIEINNLKNQIEKLEKENSEKIKQVLESQSKVSTFAKKIEHLETENDKNQKSLKEYQAKCAQQESKLTELEREKESKIEPMHHKIEYLEKERASNLFNLKESNSKINELEKRISTLNEKDNEISDLKRNLSEKASEIKSIHSKYFALEELERKTKSSLEKAKQEIDDQAKAISNDIKSIESLKEKIKSLENEIKEVNSLNAELNKKIHEFDSQLKKEKKEIEAFKKHKDEEKNDFDKSQSELADQLKKTLKIKQKMEKDLEKLEEKIENEKETNKNLNEKNNQHTQANDKLKEDAVLLSAEIKKIQNETKESQERVIQMVDLHKLEVSKLNDKVKTKETELKLLNEELSKAKRNFESLNASKEDLKLQMEKHDSNSKKQIEKLQAIILIKDEENENLSKNLKDKESLNENIISLKMINQKLQNEHDHLVNSSNILKHSFVDICEIKKTLEDEVISKSETIKKLKEELENISSRVKLATLSNIENNSSVKYTEQNNQGINTIKDLKIEEESDQNVVLPEIENQKAHTELNSALKKAMDYENNIASITEKLNSLKQDISILKKENKKLNLDLKKSMKENLKMNKLTKKIESNDIDEKHKDEISILTQKITDLEAELNKLRKKETENEKINEELKILKAKRTQTLSPTKEILNSQNENQSKNKIKTFDDLSDKIKFETTKKEYLVLVDVYETQLKRISVLEGDKKFLEAKAFKSEKEYKNAEKTIESLNKEITYRKEAEEVQTKLKLTIKELKQEVDQAKETLKDREKLVKNVEIVTNEKEKVKKELVKLKKIVKTLNFDLQKNKKSATSSLLKIKLQEKQLKKLDGIEEHSNGLSKENKQLLTKLNKTLEDSQKDQQTLKTLRHQLQELKNIAKINKQNTQYISELEKANDEFSKSFAVKEKEIGEFNKVKHGFESKIEKILEQIQKKEELIVKIESSKKETELKSKNAITHLKEDYETKLNDLKQKQRKTEADLKEEIEELKSEILKVKLENRQILNEIKRSNRKNEREKKGEQPKISKTSVKEKTDNQQRINLKKIEELKKKLDKCCEFQDNCVAFVQEFVEQLEDLQYWSPMNPVNWAEIETNLSQASKENPLIKQLLPRSKVIFKFLETLLEENSQFWLRKIISNLKTKKNENGIRKTKPKNKKKAIEMIDSDESESSDYDEKLNKGTLNKDYFLRKRVKLSEKRNIKTLAAEETGQTKLNSKRRKT